MIFSFWMRPLPPTLGNHIAGIVLIGSEHQMLWISTNRVVAFVHNDKPIWNGTVCERPRHSMDIPVCVQMGYKAVPLVTYLASPQPAVIGFPKLGPEPFLEMYVGFSSRQATTISGVAGPQISTINRVFETARASTYPVIVPPANVGEADSGPPPEDFSCKISTCHRDPSGHFDAGLQDASTSCGPSLYFTPKYMRLAA